MYLGHVSGRKVVPDCRRLGSSASDCRLQKGYPLCACQHTENVGKVNSRGLGLGLPYDVGPARVFLGEAEKTPWHDVWFRPCIAGQDWGQG